jgi:hypothetical protein
MDAVSLFALQHTFLSPTRIQLFILHQQAHAACSNSMSASLVFMLLLFVQDTCGAQ